MGEDEKRNFILNIFKNSYGENVEDLSYIDDKIRHYKEYAERKKQALEMNDGSYEWYLENYKDYDFLEDTELSPQDIKQIIDTIYNLSVSGYWDGEERKTKLVQYIFEHVSDDSKVAYFRSNEFQNLFSNNEFENEILEDYNIGAIWQSISKENNLIISLSV